MKIKNRFLSILIAVVMVLPAVFLFASCGKKEKTYSVSVVLSGQGESNNGITLSNYDTVVDAGKTTAIEVNFASGYDHKQLVAKLNGVEVSGVVVYSETGEELSETDNVDYTKTRTWKLKLENIRENKKVEIDVENCGLVDVKLTLNSNESSTARIALKNRAYVGYVTDLNENTVLGFSNFDGINAKVPYGEPFYVLLNSNVESIYIDGRGYLSASLFGKKYLKNGQSVFYIYDGITSPSVMSIRRGVETEQQYFADEYNCFHLDVSTLEENVGFLYHSWWTEKDYNGYLNTDIVDGVVVKDITSTSGTTHLMYIGNKDVDSESVKVPNIEYISNKMYVKINVYDETLFANGSFYLAKNKDGKNKIKLPDTCIKKSENDNTFIVLNYADVIDYFKIVETSSDSSYLTGHAFLFFELNQAYVCEKMTGFKANSIENLNEPFRLNVTSVDDLNSFKYIQNGTYYFNNSDIFDTENNYKNNVSLVAGINYADLLHNRYSKVTASIVDKNGNVLNFETDLQNKDFAIDKAGKVLINLPTINVENKIITVNLTYEVLPRDRSEHVVSFEKLNLDTAELYVSYDMKTWTKITKDTANFVISYEKPLYYYSTDNSIKLSVKDASDNTVSEEYYSDFMADIDDVTITVGDDFDAKKVLPLRLVNGYIGEDVTLYLV